MSAYSIGYLIGAVFNFLLWGAIFALRKDLRREMLEMSLWAAAIGLPHEYLLWTRDWWHPPTITGTAVGFEDLIYALSTGGVLSALYAVVLRRRGIGDKRPPGPALRYAPMIFDFVTPLVLVPVFGFHSFVACGVGVLLALVCIFAVRPDLIVVALASAVLGVLISLPCYWLIEWLLPGFIRAVWDLPRLSGILLAGIPIEDLAWYAYSAALFGTYYKYAVGQRFVRR
jgi:Lycopene cyclase